MNPFELDLDNRFTYHPATDEKKWAHEGMRSACRWLAGYICSQTADGRERALAILKLEEAMFWANAAIARNV